MIGAWILLARRSPLLLTAASALLVASCRGTRTPGVMPSSPAPFSITGATPTAAATGHAATATAAVTASPPLTHQPSHAPFPVVTTLEEAQRLVMGWSNPDGSARVGRSGYVAADDVVKVFSAAGVEELPFFGGEVGGMDTTVPPSWIPQYQSGPIIFVEVTQGGMDVRSADQSGSYVSTCYPVSGSARYTVAAVFDAATGTHLGYLTGQLPAGLWAHASTNGSVVWVTATPTSTTPVAPTPSRREHIAPTATTEYVTGESAGSALTSGHVPTEVRAMVDVVPWVAGSWWSYRHTGVEDGIHWWTTTVTETVEEARRVSPDVMAVRLAWTSDNDDFWVSPWGQLPDDYGRSQVYVLRDSVIWPDERKHYPFAVDALASEAGALAAGKSPDDDADLPSEMIRLPLKVGDGYNLWSVGDPETVRTPAGTFEGCYTLSEIYNARSSWFHWLCPGVGFVRHERWGCTSFSGAAEVYELSGYHVPVIVAEP